MQMIPELNKIYLGDALEVLKQWPDGFVDLIITSPPYNCGIRYDNWNDRMKWNDYYNWCEQWLKELLRVLKKDGRLCLNHYLSLGSGEHGYKVGIKNNTYQDDNFISRHAPLMKLNEIAERIGF